MHIHIHIHTHIHLHTCSFAFTFICIHIYIVRTVRCWQCICHDMKEFIYIYSLIQPCLIIEVHVLLKILLNIYISLHLWLYYLVFSILCMSWDFITMTCVPIPTFGSCHMPYALMFSIWKSWCLQAAYIIQTSMTRPVVTGHPIASD